MNVIEDYRNDQHVCFYIIGCAGTKPLTSYGSGKPTKILFCLNIIVDVISVGRGIMR